MNVGKVLVATLINFSLISFTVGHGSSLGFVAPLLPVATITGNAGLLTAGLTGAALLKLKAAAAIAYWLSIRKHKFHKAGGWRWGWDDRRRRRRETEMTKEDKVSKSEKILTEIVDMSKYDPSLDEVLQYDQLGCGMRLVCELSATPDTSLMEDEKLILDLFGRDGKVPNAEKASRGKLSYSYAALLGSHSEDNKVCSNVYGRCPYSASQIMYSLRDITI